ncbi:MAG: VWA domain-containing protein [Nanoarchaeota archaeon]|nr:VWA domain-containing protein [Nanoarchaeota archaeon]
MIERCPGDTQSELEETHRLVGDFSSIDELDGKLSRNSEEDKLMHSVMEGDKETIEDGKLITDSINYGLGSFTPDILFESLVNEYQLTKRIVGESIIRELTGYDPNFIEKNLALPEFKKQLKEKITQTVEKLKEKGLVNKEGLITKKGLRLSSLILYTEELDNLVPKGFGEKADHKKSEYGDKTDYEAYKHQRYRDIAIRQSVKTAIRRKHDTIQTNDFKVFQRKKKGKISIIYAMDSSGSMKGDKIDTAKKAGIALAFKAINEKNRVGLIIFDSEVRKIIPPTRDFLEILEELTKVRAGFQTDIKKVIEKAIETFPKGNETKHLVLLTDALPTKGDNPEKETLKAVSSARNQKITLSLIGINLDDKGMDLARKITEIGDGKLYLVKDIKELDKIILEDYYSIK